MTTYEEITGMLDTLQSPIESNLHGLTEAMDVRMVWLARSAQLLATAQWELSGARKKCRDLLISVHPEMSITDRKQSVEDACRDEQRTVTSADRLNSTLIHSLDALRSILSAEKKQIPDSGFSRQRYNEPSPTGF